MLTSLGDGCQKNQPQLMHCESTEGGGQIGSAKINTAPPLLQSVLKVTDNVRKYLDSSVRPLSWTGKAVKVEAAGSMVLVSCNSGL